MRFAGRFLRCLEEAARVLKEKSQTSVENKPARTVMEPHQSSPVDRRGRDLIRVSSSSPQPSPLRKLWHNFPRGLSQRLSVPPVSNKTLGSRFPFTVRGFGLRAKFFRLPARPGRTQPP
jgi:hypothetical protein